MAPLPTAVLALNALLFFLLEVTAADQKNITAESGQNVTLTCRAPNKSFTILEWNRADLSEEVFVYRDGKFVRDQQYASFKNRVDLQDKQMKDGDVSVILKNVMAADSGTYECRVQREGDSMKLMNTINLRVVAPPPGQGGTTGDGGEEDGGKEDARKEDGGKEDARKEDARKEDGGKEDARKEDARKEDGGSVRVIVGLSVSALVAAAAVVLLIYRKHLQSFLQSPKCRDQVVLKSISQRS